MPKRRGGLDASAFMLCYHNVPISPGGVFWAPRRRAAHPRGAAASPGARQRGHRLLQRAAVNGSPLSGSYAGAKATIRFIASYAASESGRNALGIRFTSVLPQLTPETDLGAAGVAAYAARQGAPVSPPSSTASARRSPRSRWAPRSSTSPPAPPMTATRTCSPPTTPARCGNALVTSSAAAHHCPGSTVRVKLFRLPADQHRRSAATRSEGFLAL